MLAHRLTSLRFRKKINNGVISLRRKIWSRHGDRPLLCITHFLMPGITPIQPFQSAPSLLLPPTNPSSSSSSSSIAAMASSSSSSVAPPTPDAAASLQALDGLLTEFFSPTTSNQRKREIEALLNDFGSQKDSWKLGFYFLANTPNEYVMMYSMTVIEEVINKRWQGKWRLQQRQQRRQLRQRQQPQRQEPQQEQLKQRLQQLQQRQQLKW